MGFNLFGLGRRRHFIVRRKLQERFVSILLLQMTVVLFLIAGFAYYWNLKQRQIAEPAVGTPDADIIYQNMQWFLLRTLFLIAAASIILIFFGILASHKIAGPVYKMEKYLNELKDGNFQKKIQFRRSDKLDDLAKVLNKAAAGLQGKKSYRAEQIKLAEQKLGSLAEQVESPDKDLKEALPQLEDLKVMVERLAVGPK